MSRADTGRLLNLATKVLTQKAVERAHGGWIPEKQRVQQQRQAVKAQEKQKKETEKRFKLQTGGGAEDESGRMPTHTDINGDIITQKLSTPTTFLRGIDLEANVPQFATGAPQLTPPQAGGAPILLEQRAKNLQDWHEGSHEFTKNENGSPKVFYHGTNKEDFSEFKLPGKKGTGGNAIFVSEDPETASYFTHKAERSRIYPVHVSAKNIFNHENENDGNKLADFVYKNHNKLFPGALYGPSTSAAWAKSGDWGILEHPEVTKWMKKQGYDGFFVKEHKGGKTNLGIFNPNQIKSATGNQGTFDPSNPDITKARGGEVQNLKDGGRVYPLADRDQWKLHHLEKDDSKLVHMEPNEFFDKAQKLEDTKENKKDIKHWEKKIKKGDKLGPAALYTDGSQDGRHRVEAAKKMGIKKVPVLTWPERGTEPAKEYVKSATKIARKASKK